MAPLIRLVVVDDHPVVAQGTAELLTHAGMIVVACANTLHDAVRLARELTPDVVLSDVMFGTEPLGLGLAARLQAAGSSSRVLLFSSYDPPYFLARAVREGASGYLSKSASAADLIGAVRTVAQGHLAFRLATMRLAESHRAPSPRELEIIELVSEGISNGEIGLRLGIGERTVETYLQDLYVRYDLNSRTHLAIYAIQQGWLPDRALTTRAK